MPQFLTNFYLTLKRPKDGEHFSIFIRRESFKSYIMDHYEEETYRNGKRKEGNRDTKLSNMVKGYSRIGDRAV
jgi:hypothetical protein